MSIGERANFPADFGGLFKGCRRAMDVLFQQRENGTLFHEWVAGEPAIEANLQLFWKMRFVRGIILPVGSQSRVLHNSMPRGIFDAR